MLALEGEIGAVLRGKNGRLFLGNQDGFDVRTFTDGRSLALRRGRAWRRTMERRARLLADRGVPYIVHICPDAHSIFPEDLPDDVPADFLTPGEQFVLETQGIENLRVVYPRAALLSAKGSLDLYKKNDTHWSQYGSYIGYQKLCDALEGVVPFTRIPARDIAFTLKRGFGDLGSLVEPEQSALAPVATLHGHKAELVGYNEGVGRINIG
jgi:hypothetical protein